MDRLARNHRIIAFDRPGYGFISRLSGHFWTPAAQAALSREVMVKPVQLRGNAEDAIVDTSDHCARLHGELPQSKLHIVPGTGHMPHYTALDLVVSAIDELAPAIARVHAVPVSQPARVDSVDSPTLSTAGPKY